MTGTRGSDDGLDLMQETRFDNDIEVSVRGQGLVAALDELVGSMSNVTDREGAVRRSISVLYQAMNRRIVLVDDAGLQSELKGVWR